MGGTILGIEWWPLGNVLVFPDGFLIVSICGPSPSGSQETGIWGGWRSHSGTWMVATRQSPYFSLGFPYGFMFFLPNFGTMPNLGSLDSQETWIWGVWRTTGKMVSFFVSYKLWDRAPWAPKRHGLGEVGGAILGPRWWPLGKVLVFP